MRRFEPSIRSVAGALAVAALVAGALAPAAGARTAFGGNACTLLSAGQLSPLHIGSKCKHKTIPVVLGGTNAGTIDWGLYGKQFNGAVLIDVYVVDSTYLALAKAKFNTGGTPVGVGDWSRFKGFSNGKTGAEITFGVGSYIVDVSIDTKPRYPLKSKSQVISLAKHVAAGL